MRNSKVKGFTLIELIVVIAIIGILAAILVPSMLGYVRNARISQANANAKQVHTAVSSALTQLGISNIPLANGGNTTTPTVSTVVISPAANNVIPCAWTPAQDARVTNEKMDLISYLGENFNGQGQAWFNPSTYSVLCAAYAADATTLGVAASHIGTDGTNSAGEQTQKTDAKNGSLYGIYPQGTDTATGGNNANNGNNANP